MSEDKEKFEVKDRRKILMGDEEEAVEAGKEEAAPKAEEPRKEHPKSEEPPKEEPGAERASGGGAPAPDFIAFIGSLGGSALMYLGERLTPEQPPMEVNLPAARQMIDILDMLKQKTAGNLDEDERVSLDNLLYNLKMRYTQAVETGG